MLRDLSSDDYDAMNLPNGSKHMPFAFWSICFIAAASLMLWIIIWESIPHDAK